MDKINKVSKCLAEIIKEERGKQKLTQEQLANLAKIDYKHIQNFESLKRTNDPKLSTICKLAEALGMSPSKLIQKIEKRI